MAILSPCTLALVAWCSGTAHAIISSAGASRKAGQMPWLTATYPIPQYPPTARYPVPPNPLQWARPYGAAAAGPYNVAAQSVRGRRRKQMPNKPNILYIVADDLGWSDIADKNPTVTTPTLSRLAKAGVVLDSFYTQPVCAATRAAILTGRYPHRMGFQHFNPTRPFGGVAGLPLKETLLPQLLQRAGYKTHAIGKWHLGHAKKEYLPQYRGFDSYYGFWEGSIDYNDHTEGKLFEDLHYAEKNTKGHCQHAKGVYDLELLTAHAMSTIAAHKESEPLFMYLAYHNVHGPAKAPVDFFQPCPTSVWSDVDKRRTMCAMLFAMDTALNRTVETWKNVHGAEFWLNSIVIFHSDNGGATHPNGGGSNEPLRGGKNTLFDGAMRVVSMVVSPTIKMPNRVEKGLIHVTDMVPTILSLAGVDHPMPQILDGVNVWETISGAAPSPRTEIIHLIDPLGNSDLSAGPQHFGCQAMGVPGACETSAAIRSGNYKLIVGMWAACTKLPKMHRLCGWTKYRERGTQLSLLQKSVEEVNVTQFFAGLAERVGSGLNRSGVVNQLHHIHESSIPYVLYDIVNDPTEQNDVADQQQDIAKQLIDRLEKHAAETEWMDPQWPPYKVCDTADGKCDVQFLTYATKAMMNGLCVDSFLDVQEHGKSLENAITEGAEDAIAEDAGIIAEAAGNIATGAGAITDNAHKIADGAGTAIREGLNIIEGVTGKIEGADAIVNDAESVLDTAGNIANMAGGVIHAGADTVNQDAHKIAVDADNAANAAENKDTVGDINAGVMDPGTADAIADVLKGGMNGGVAGAIGGALGVNDEIDKFREGLPKIRDGFNDARRIASDAVNGGTGKVVGAIREAIPHSIVHAIDTAGENINGIWNYITGNKTVIVPNVAAGVSDAIGAVEEGASNIKDSVADAGVGNGEVASKPEAVTDPKDDFGQAIAGAADAVAGLSNISGAFQGLPDAVNQLVNSGVEQVAGAVQEGAGVVNQVNQVVNQVVNDPMRMRSVQAKAAPAGADMHAASRAGHLGGSAVGHGTGAWPALPGAGLFAHSAWFTDPQVTYYE